MAGLGNYCLSQSLVTRQDQLPQVFDIVSEVKTIRILPVLLEVLDGHIHRII
jgi:hypothetical protein